jgi:Cu/Zn superoxide dismutase
MQALPRLMIVSAFAFAIGCSSSSSPSGTGGNKGTGGAGTGGSGTGGAGTGGAGTGGSTGGSSAPDGSADAAKPDSGSSDGAVTVDGASSDAATTDGATSSNDGGVTARAVAMVMATPGGTIEGTVTFEQRGTDVTATYNLTTCPAGVHATHIHVGPTCAAADPMLIAGAHWASPRGDGMFGNGMITCTGANTFTGSYTRTAADPAAAWTITGDGSATDIVGHAVVVHGPGGASERFGCGVIMKSP